MVAGGDVVYASDVNQPPTVLAQAADDGTGLTGTAYFTGYTGCQIAFTAPASGRIRMTILGILGLTTPASGIVNMSAIVRTGEILGAGAVVYDPKSFDPGCKISIGGVAGLFAQLSAASIIGGLTSGARYNAQVVTWAGAAGTTYAYYGREVSVSPAS